jgi:hypothetical protein
MKSDGIAEISVIFIIMWRLPAVMCFGMVLLLFPAERPFNRNFALISFVRERPYPVLSDLQTVFISSAFLTSVSCDLTFTGLQR